MKKSPKLEKAIQEFINTPLEVGETVYCYKLSKSYTYKVLEIEDDIVSLKCEYYKTGNIERVRVSDISSRFKVRNIGANPFERKYTSIRPIAYNFESIDFALELTEKKGRDYEINNKKIAEVNWNPFIYDKEGVKKYYQRDFVWNLKDKQLLIESIYNNISCGLILIRNRSWEELVKLEKNGETELAFRDIVDGKQRLNAVSLFMNDEFTDLNGNYYSDLSIESRRLFKNHQLFQYCEMNDVSDEDVIYQFLKTNFTGKPQSVEHIEYVKTLLNK